MQYFAPLFHRLAYFAVGFRDRVLFQHQNTASCVDHLFFFVYPDFCLMQHDEKPLLATQLADY